MGNLWLLDLSRNNIAVIPQGSLQNNKQLEGLRMNYNQITFLPALMTWLAYPGGELDYLEVSNNQISQFGDPNSPWCAFRNPGGNLDMIDISFNKLKVGFLCR